jgi:hypothetical protein
MEGMSLGETKVVVLPFNWAFKEQDDRPDHNVELLVGYISRASDVGFLTLLQRDLPQKHHPRVSEREKDGRKGRA